MGRSLKYCVLLILAGGTLAGCSSHPWLTEQNVGPRVVVLETPRWERPEVEPVAPPHLPAWNVAQTDRQWRYIVIHHSATNGGSAAAFDKAHRKRGWDELGYHFVVDNGNGGTDGKVEIGSRWNKQKHGAHTGGTPDNLYNEAGIGICVVGDFTTHLPTSQLRKTLESLVTYLAWEYDIPPENVITHRDAPNAKTECPGGVFHSYVAHEFKERIGYYLAQYPKPLGRWVASR